MRNIRVAEQALRLTSISAPQKYVCKACRIHAARQLHTSPPRAAEEPFFKRLQATLFGSKESKEAERQREEKQKRRLEELAANDDDVALDVKTDKDGRKYEVAAIVDPTLNKDYVQATTWDGLESVGGEEWVKAIEDTGEQYVGFVPKKRTELTNRQWEMLLHHITVEVLVLQKAGRHAGQVCYPHVANSSSWMHTRSATIRPGASGKGVSITFPDPQAEQAILAAIPGEPLADQQTLSNELAGAIATSEAETQPPPRTPRAWMNVSLQDPMLKMAIIKRALQLTGKRLPDPVISTSTSIADLYNALGEREKAKKLFETPQLQRLKVAAPNVNVYSKRQTPIHKEKAVGRWKIIQEELEARDLPVTGSRWQGAKANIK